MSNFIKNCLNSALIKERIRLNYYFLFYAILICVCSGISNIQGHCKTPENSVQADYFAYNKVCANPLQSYELGVISYELGVGSWELGVAAVFE